MTDKSELAEELRDLQAVCERFGVDDDGVLDRAADRLEAAEAELADKFETFEEWKASVIGIKELEDSICLREAKATIKAVGDLIDNPDLYRFEVDDNGILKSAVSTEKIQALIEEPRLIDLLAIPPDER